MSTKRVRKLEIAIQKEFSEILRREIKDPRINFVTVTKVKVSEDLKIANIYVSVYGSEEEKEQSMKGLKSAKGYIRSLFGKRFNLRFIPDIRFFFDKSIEEGIRITKLISEIREKEGNKIENNKQ